MQCVIDSLDLIHQGQSPENYSRNCSRWQIRCQRVRRASPPTSPAGRHCSLSAGTRRGRVRSIAAGVDGKGERIDAGSDPAAPGYQAGPFLGSFHVKAVFTPSA